MLRARYRHTLLTDVNHLASLQAHATNNTMTAANRRLAYCARYPNNSLRYHACDLILHIQSGASYLSRPGARSVAGGIFYVGNRDQPTVINGAIHAISSIIPAAVTSMAEAEYAALFLNGQEAASLRDTLTALGYPLQATIIQCDNKCAQGIATDTVKPKRTESIDMKFHWIRDRLCQGQFMIMWRKGTDNLADFLTKLLPVHQHQRLMPLLVHVPCATGLPAQTAHSKRKRY